MHSSRIAAIALLFAVGLIVAGLPLAIATGPPLKGCAGDCNADGEVTIDELVKGRQISRGDEDLSECPAADADGSGTVSGIDLEAAADDASGRCAPVPVTPVPFAPELSAINAGAVSSNPGRVIQLDVSLFPAGNAVFATQNYLSYGSGLSVVVAEGSQPACQVVEELAGAVAAFAFGPDGCVPGDDCDRVLAYVDASADGQRIQTKSLYRCQISIDADASPGFHPIMVLAPLATDAAGARFVTTAFNGAVNVRPPATATPTPTPTGTPTSTPTETPTITPTAAPSETSTPTATLAIDTPTEVATPTPTATRVVASCVGDCDGGGTVGVSELVQLVGIALDTLAPDTCAAIGAGAGAGAGTEVTIDLLVLAVRNAIDGCGSAAL